ncbi:hypothetical protein D3C83_12440 [compost metagenome]
MFEAAGFVQQPSEIDTRIEARRIGGDRLLVGIQRGLGVPVLQRDCALEPFFGRGLLRETVALDDAQRSVSGIALEGEQVLPGIGLPARLPLLHDHAVGHRANAEPRQRHGVRQAATKLLHGFRDAPPRHVGGGERLSGAQDDQILE